MKFDCRAQISERSTKDAVEFDIFRAALTLIKPGRRSEFIGIHMQRINILRHAITDITGTARKKVLKIPWGLKHWVF